LYQLNNEGSISDLADLHRSHDLELYPYALGRAVETEHDSVGGQTTSGYLGGKVGVDAKLAITPTVTADLTVNTDFVQVEADQQVINLTRFPFFFPEKREFCLESSGLLDLALIIHGGSLEPKVWIAGSQTPGVAGTPLAWRLSTDNPNDLFDNFVSRYRIYSGFAPPLGFVRRTGIWETTGHVDFMPRPGALGIRQLDFTFPIPSWDVIANEQGSLFRSADWQTAWFEWRVFGGDRQNGDHFEVNFQRLMDAPTDAFDIFPGVVIPPGRYWWSRYELQYFMNAGRPLRFGAFANWGQFYGGHSTDLELSAAWRGGGHIIVSTDLIRTRAELPVGAFIAVLSANRLEYDFDTRTSLLAFVQYDN